MIKSKFTKNIEPHIQKQLAFARRSRDMKEYHQEFQYLENAHILGQASTYWHTKIHIHMLEWAVRNKIRKEIVGQILRIAGAALKTPLGLVPEGNTGGSNVSPFRKMPIAPEYRKIINSAKVGA